MAGFLREYSDEELLEQVREHYRRNPGMTRKSFEDDDSVCSSIIVYKRFGGWDKALLKSGILDTITKESIIEDLKDHYLRNGRITRESFNNDKTIYSSKIVELRFGGWLKALKSAGLKKTKPKKKSVENIGSGKEPVKKREVIYTNAELIGKYRRLIKKDRYKKKRILLEEFCKELSIAENLIINNFGDWNNFCKVAKPLKKQ